ncbi:MAG: hypothetical protein JSW50_04600, partial [Candidatus Latescibacterota bacterium]
MSKIHSGATARGCGVLYVALAMVTVLPTAAPWAAEEMSKNVQPPKVTRSLQGTYEIQRSGQDIGTETFFLRVLSNNTVVVESTYDVVADDGTFVTGNNRLELEDDSGFPVSYYTLRKTQSESSEQVRESTANMYANVLVWDNRSGDRDER